MFDDEREAWKAFFETYEAKFGEEVGLVPDLVETDEIEVDLVVGQETGNIFGVKIVQFLDSNEDRDIESDEINNPSDENESDDESDDENESDDEDDDIDESAVDAVEYEFIREDSVEDKPKGVPIVEFIINETDDEENSETDPAQPINPSKMIIYGIPANWNNDSELESQNIEEVPKDKFYRWEFTGVVFFEGDEPEKPIIFLEKLEEE